MLILFESIVHLLHGVGKHLSKHDLIYIRKLLA